MNTARRTETQTGRETVQLDFNPDATVEHERGLNLERRRHSAVLFQTLFRRSAQRLIIPTKFAQQRVLSRAKG